MLETPHVIVAAAIASKVGNPFLAIPLAFGSHFILDGIPHWNPRITTEMKKDGKLSNFSKKIIFTDVALSLISGFYIASLSLPDNIRFITVLFSCFAAIIPDLIEAPYYLWGKKTDFVLKKWVPFKKSLQADASPIPGILSQILVIAASTYWIMN